MSETLYYYAARKDDGRHKDIPTERFPHKTAKKWTTEFLVLHSYLEPGMYDHENGNRYYLDRLSWEDFDMLTAFGVECVTEFHAGYPCMDVDTGTVSYRHVGKDGVATFKRA